MNRQVYITYIPRRGSACLNGKPPGTGADRRRFWAKVSVSESDTACWEWSGARNPRTGYGQFAWASRYGRCRPVGAHREKGRLAIARRRTRAAKDLVVARYLAGGITMRALADEFGVHKMTVQRWLAGLHRPYQRPVVRAQVA